MVPALADILIVVLLLLPCVRENILNLGLSAQRTTNPTGNNQHCLSALNNLQFVSIQAEKIKPLFYKNLLKYGNLTANGV